jgi:uncharacterized membrane protein YdjX (TVP38/TMEM64 family)
MPEALGDVMRKADTLRALALLALIAAAVAGLVVLSVNAPLREALGESLGRFRGWAWGPVVFAVAYALACLVLPGSLISLAAGSLFGVVVGTVVVSLASVTGASLAFWLGRTLARGLVEKRLAGNPRFRALDQAVAAGGFKIVLLARLSPLLPFTLLNYAFGLTKVRFHDYLLASWIGMLPGTVLYVYLGSTVTEVADVATGNLAGGPARSVLFFVGLAATVVVTVYVTRLARQALRQAAPDLTRAMSDEG